MRVLFRAVCSTPDLATLSPEMTTRLATLHARCGRSQQSACSGVKTNDAFCKHGLHGTKPAVRSTLAAYQELAGVLAAGRLLHATYMQSYRRCE